MLYSYDIFDTVLYRRVPNPTDIFRVMDDELQEIWPLEKTPFSIYRKKSEFWLRRISRKEISIEDIYGEIKKRSGINIDWNIEFRTEKAWSFINPKIVGEIKQRIADNEKVILISDMYWHETQLREWLTEKDEIFKKIPIYSSCDYDGTKINGKLFKTVQIIEQANMHSWIHTGDNKKADGSIPRQLGITSVIVPKAQRYDFEKRIARSNVNMLPVYGIIAESRVTANNYAYDIGASIVAPMVYQYVDWVLEQAEKKGIVSLYFVLRDGYILKTVADKIINKRGLNVKTNFIFGSRVAWRFPKLTIEKLHHLSVWEKSNWIFKDPAIAYVPFERMGFSRKSLDDIMGSDFGRKELHSFREFKKTMEFSLKNKRFVTELENNIKRAGEILDEYMMSNLDVSTSFAFVDTNSTGKTQDDLNKFMQEKHPQIKLCFFYHTYLADRQPDETTQFVFTVAKEDDRRFPEAFFRAPFNQCYGYERTERGVEPRFHESEYCAWSYSFDYDSYLAGIISFTEMMEKHQQEKINLSEYVQYLLKVVNFEILSMDEVKQAAKMPFNPNLNGDEILDFYPKIKASALFHPFSELIYYPKGSYYNAGGLWIVLYKCLSKFVQIKRRKSKNAGQDS